MGYISLTNLQAKPLVECKYLTPKSLEICGVLAFTVAGMDIFFYYYYFESHKTIKRDWSVKLVRIIQVSCLVYKWILKIITPYETVGNIMTEGTTQLEDGWKCSVWLRSSIYTDFDVMLYVEVVILMTSVLPMYFWKDLFFFASYMWRLGRRSATTLQHCRLRGSLRMNSEHRTFLAGGKCASNRRDS